MSSVADLAECAGDPRSADKLIDGCNASNNDHHTWLAPYRRGEPTVICLMFDEPVTLSVLKIWNYSKVLGGEAGSDYAIPCILTCLGLNGDGVSRTPGVQGTPGRLLSTSAPCLRMHADACGWT